MTIATPLNDGLFEQTFLSTNHGRFTPAQAVNALLAMDRILSRSPLILNNRLRRKAILEARVYVEDLHAGSLFQKYLIKFLFKDEQGEDEFFEWLRSNTGMDKSKVRVLITAITTGLIAAGATYGTYKYLSGKEAGERAPVVVAWNNNIIQLGAGELQMTPREFSMILDRAGGRPQNAKDVSRLLKATKADPQAMAILQAVDAPQFSIPNEVIDAVPTHEEISERDPDGSTKLEKVTVYLRATDLDNVKTGWAATVEEISDRRLKLELADNIRPEMIFGRKTVTADIEAIFKRLATGDRRYQSYRITRIYAE